MSRSGRALAGVAMLALPALATAASHELRIHTDEIAGHREHVLEIHSNVSRTRGGNDEPRRTVLRAMPEYAYGFARNWETSLALPVTHAGGDLKVNGGRAEVQYVAPHDRKQGFYWGLNAELAYSKHIEEQSSWSVELTPIAGVRAGRWHFALNPALSRKFSGAERRVEFEPAGMAMFSLNDGHEIGVEYYAEFGRLEHFAAVKEQSHLALAVWRYERGPLELNFGVGRGLTRSSDRWVAKLVVELSPK